MANLFNSVQVVERGYNSFPLSFSNKFTADLGLLYPTMSKEVLPGDVFDISLMSLVRTQPLASPILSNFYHDTYFFFVPNRLIFEDWTKFIVRGDDGMTDYQQPYVEAFDFFGSDASVFQRSQLLDYLNFPSVPQNVTLASAPNIRIKMLKLNAYNLIFNEYFRDENLSYEVPIFNKQGYSDNISEVWQPALSDLAQQTGWLPLQCAQYLNPFLLRHRSWRKDYFTSALPFAQKGPQISVSQQVSYESMVPVYFSQATDSSLQDTSTNKYTFARQSLVPFPLGTGNNFTNLYNLGTNDIRRDINAYADLSSLQHLTMTLDDLRTSVALMQWYELNARTGTSRYAEYLLGHFNVRDRDSRLQRPEYLGSHHGVITVSDVEQTSETDDNGTAQGTLAGKGLGQDANHVCRFFVPEHGWIFAITSIMPHAVYYEGLGREWSRWDSFDYYDPLFDHLSEQNIKRQELFFNYIDTNMDVTYNGDHNEADFGYIPRFSEYRFYHNELHGEFRGNLNYWVPRRKDLAANSQLDEPFIMVDGYRQNLYDTFSFPGTQSSQSPHFLCYFQFAIKSLRKMSKYATPGVRFI